MRKYRAFFHKFFQPAAVPEYHALKENEVLNLLRGLMVDPGHYNKHVRR